MSEPMRSVVVVGGGITAWSAAAALKRHIPSLDVTIVSSPVSDDAIADRICCTLPSITVFHEDLGLSEIDTVVGARSGLRIGTIFEGWSEGRSPYVHAYGSYGAAAEGIAFHQLWLRARSAKAIPGFEHFSVASELGRLGRVGVDAPAGASIGYGLHLTIERYAAMMRAFALHLGGREQSCTGFTVQLRPDDGFVETLMLDNGARVSGDLFVDCTGPAVAIRQALGHDFEEWGEWLPCDRLVMSEEPGGGDAAILDRVTATAAGWQWETSSPTSTIHGTVYSSAYAEEAPEEENAIKIRQGCRAEPWLRNCVAIGDAAVMVEPLEWANLHLAHSQIDRLISMMPGRDCAPVELKEYNRQCLDEARRVRDFLCMHYVTARRDEPFWKDVASIDPPASLAHTLALFAERGRLPYYEEETFSRDSWVAVLLGQGFEPRATDPLADMLTMDQVARELDRQLNTARKFAEAQPLYSDYLSSLSHRGVQ